MADQVPWLGRLDCLAARFEALKSSTFDESGRKVRKARFQRILEDVCGVVRDAEQHVAPQLAEVVEEAHDLLEACLEYAHSDSVLKSLNTFAHSDDEPWIDDVMENAGSDLMDEFIRLYSKSLKPGCPAPPLPSFARIRPWPKSPRPHPLTTRLSRFRPDIVPTANAATPLARVIAEARAQLTTDLIPTTYGMAVSSGGSILALASGGGLKGRQPLLQYYLLGAQSDNCLEGVGMDPGLSSAPRFVAADEDRKLVFVADDDNIKSFSFGPVAGGKVPKRLPNVHTMSSAGGYDGPIAVLPNGRIARAGKGKAVVWDLTAADGHQGQPAHKAGSPVGDGAAGRSPDSTIDFTDDPSFTPATWHLHTPTSRLLCGEHAGRSGGRGCVALDLEHGGRRAARYLGHGGDVLRITTSQGDPNLFATASSDGYARLFDTRRPLPVLTVETGLQRDACTDVVFVHPDGIPTLFTAGERTQQVKMWDLRERECVYELATGNNAVRALAWDAARAALFVATACPHLDRLGARAGYRRARVPAWAAWAGVERDYRAYRAGAPHGPGGLGRVGAPIADGSVREDEEDERGYYECEEDEEEGEGEGDEEIDEAYSADMRWPDKCFHKENYFGYAYDAGDHVLFRWHFKEEPDITQLPASTTNDDW